jgi:hypothetical protein
MEPPLASTGPMFPGAGSHACQAAAAGTVKHDGGGADVAAGGDGLAGRVSDKGLVCLGRDDLVRVGRASVAFVAFVPFVAFEAFVVLAEIDGAVHRVSLASPVEHGTLQ